MKPTKKFFANRYETRTMGNYQVQYDTVTDHDTYNWLRVSFEVDREKDRAVLLLNGKEIGEVWALETYSGKMVFAAYRYSKDKTPTLIRPEHFKDLGHAGAAIISEYVN